MKTLKTDYLFLALCFLVLSSTWCAPQPAVPQDADDEVESQVNADGADAEPGFLWQKKRPNIVYIMVDDLGYNDVSYHGSEIQTPNIDRLANEGVRLESFYLQPICTPSRIELLLGKHALRTGLQHRVISFTQDNYPPLELPSVADTLKSAGYSTHMVGKWHMGHSTRGALPTYRGFETFYGMYDGAIHYWNHSMFDWLTSSGPPYWQGGICGLDLHDDQGEDLKPEWSQDGRYITDVFTEKAISRIYDHAYNGGHKPLFLFLSYNAPHTPIQAPQWRIDKYTDTIPDERRRKYAGLVDALDEGIGNFTRALEETGLMENTIIIFTTDNGAETIVASGSNLPLRGRKGDLYEGGIRGVAFVNSPLLAKTGYINNELISIVDWYPTIAKLARAPVYGKDLDGYDVWDTISQNRKSPRHEALITIDPYVEQIGENEGGHVFDTRVSAAIRRGDWKLITGRPDGSGEFSLPHPGTQNIRLFNIKEDPYEQNEVSADHPDIVSKLLWRLHAYNKTAVPTRYPALDFRSDPELNIKAWMPWIDERIVYRDLGDPNPADQYNPCAWRPSQ